MVWSCCHSVENSVNRFFEHQNKAFSDSLLERSHEMEDILTRIIDNLFDRVSGPLQFRFYFQPIMASIFAIKSGLDDAKTGKSPYFWSLATDPNHRGDMIKDGWKSVGKVFMLALILDVIYQIIVLKWVFPFEAIVVAIVLAIIPYLHNNHVY